MELRSVFVNNSLLPYMSSPSYFAAFLQTPYFYYSKVHIVGLLQHFELESEWPSNCEISRWVSRGRVFVRRCSICRSQRSSPWNGLFVWVPTGITWRHLCATLLIQESQKVGSCQLIWGKIARSFFSWQETLLVSTRFLSFRVQGRLKFLLSFGFMVSLKFLFVYTYWNSACAGIRRKFEIFELILKLFKQKNSNFLIF